MNTIDYQAKEAARKFTANALQQAFPKLVPVSETNNGPVAAAKNIRIQLAEAFPRIKFSVKTKRYSGGNSIDIDWTDGPTGQQVDAIAQQYKAGHFDGMTDCYDYRGDHAWPDAFGSSKYIFSRRDHTPELIQKAIDYLWDRYNPEFPKVSVEDFKAGNTYTVLMVSGDWSPHWSVESQINQFMSKYDCIAQEVIAD
jgi:hypothetical protein